MQILRGSLANLEKARQKLPLKALMEQRGRGPANGKWNSFPSCPYCDGKKTAGVFRGPHGDLFKCHRANCRSGTADDGVAWDEIGFLAFELNCDRRAATRAWLKEAGLWQEDLKHSSKLRNPKSEPSVSDTTEECSSEYMGEKRDSEIADDQKDGADIANPNLRGSPFMNRSR